MMFVFLAAFIRPSTDITGLTSSEATMMENMAVMIWWMTLALVLFPIMLVLTSVAVWLFLTDKGAVTSGGMTIDRPRRSKAIGALDQGSASDVLDMRYARGEITRDQYQQMKKDVMSARL